MEEHARHVGVLLVSLHIPQAQSLKDKRMVLRSIKDKVRAHYNVSVAELDGLDKWQTATLGFAAINRDQCYLNGQLSNVLSLIERHAAGALVCDHKIEFH